MGRSYGFVDEDGKTQQVFKLINNLPKVPEWLKALSSVDYTAFIPLKNKMIIKQKDSRKITKKVVLVFDDLERCNMDCSNIWGIINDYCENGKFHTIIVANEDIIRSS